MKRERESNLNTGIRRKTSRTRERSSHRKPAVHVGHGVLKFPRPHACFRHGRGVCDDGCARTHTLCHLACTFQRIAEHGVSIPAIVVCSFCIFSCTAKSSEAAGLKGEDGVSWTVHQGSDHPVHTRRCSCSDPCLQQSTECTDPSNGRRSTGAM